MVSLNKWDIQNKLLENFTEFVYTNFIMIYRVCQIFHC